jgi:serine/threonine protein kinase
MDRHPFEELADEFVNKLRAGQPPSIEQYAQAYPQHADTIRSVFPSLVIVERVSARDATESFSSTLPLPATPTNTEAHRNFDDFQIVRCIGHGGMGLVYEAIQGSLLRKVALKVIHPQASASLKSRSRFRREAEAAAGLHHTNIVPVYGSGEDHGLLYYAMQLIHGSTLAQIIESLRIRLGITDCKETSISEQTVEAVDRLLLQKSSESPLERQSTNSYAASQSQQDPTKSLIDTTREFTLATQTETTQANRLSDPSARGRIEPNTSTVTYHLSLPKHYYRNVCRLMTKVANALDYAHQSGVLHRDIKPSNLLLDHSGTIWVADFGLARREELDGQTQTGELLGTLRYMAPEQFNGQSDPRSDIYSLGLTLFELLTLRPAFESPKRRLLDPTNYSRVEFNAQDKRSIPSDLQTIVLKASALEPKDRYARAKDLQEDLERFLEDRPILARRESFIESSIRWARRNPAIATLAATLFGLLLTLATMLALWNQQQSLTLGELKLAYAASAKSLTEQTRAFERAEIERLRAKQNMEMAIEAFATIAENITSRGRSLELQEIDDENLDSIGFADVVLTQADAKLLKSLQEFFERFALENAADLRLDVAIARRRVGEIEQKIGKSDLAIDSLQKAIEEFVSIRSKEDQNTPLDKVLKEELLARKELIGLYARRDQILKALDQLDSLRKTLDKYPDYARSTQGRFALASALSSLGSGGTRLALERGLGDRRRRSFAPMPNRPLSPGIEIPLPMAQRLQRDLGFNAEAISILESLCEQEPSADSFRLELARNYRDRMRLYRLLANPIGFEDSLKKATLIFQQLLDQNPESAVLKYELANLYTGSLVQPNVDITRLEEATRLIQEVLSEHPAVPEYQTLYASLLARNAWMIPLGSESSTERQFERVENGIAKLQQAIAIHQGLVDRFPEIQLYAINLLQAKVQLVEFTFQFRRPEKARQALADAMALGERLLESGEARQPAVRVLLDRLRERKTALENRPDPDKP